QDRRIEVAAFKRAFRTLSPTHREVLVLVAIHGLPYEEIAQICGCEVGTVKSRVNRARGILKRMLLEEELPVDARKLPTSQRAATVDHHDEFGADLAAANRLARERRRVPEARTAH